MRTWAEMQVLFYQDVRNEIERGLGQLTDQEYIMLRIVIQAVKDQDTVAALDAIPDLELKPIMDLMTRTFIKHNQPQQSPPSTKKE